MKTTFVQNLLLMAALFFPLSVVALAVENCCYDYTCGPPEPGCDRFISQNIIHKCKRMCTPTCSMNGCCDFDYQQCTYSGAFPNCPRGYDQKITNATWDQGKPKCRDDGHEVPCLETADAHCGN